MRAEFRPGLWPSLISLIAFAVLIGLGIWQLQRLAWKEDLIRTLEAGRTAPALDLPAGITDPALLDWRRVRVEGRFDHDRELHLVSGRGFVIITPLMRQDGDPVLVLRGFVPPALLPQERREEGLVAGDIAFEGIVRRDTKPNPFMPANDPAGNIWYSRDLGAMARAAGVAGALPVFVTAIEDAPGGWPRAETIAGADIPNNHLAYAITWFGLAAALLVIYVAHGLSRGRKRP